MERSTRRQHTESHAIDDTDRQCHRREALRLLQERVRQRFQDAERMYHKVGAQWNHRIIASPETSLHERVC